MLANHVKEVYIDIYLKKKGIGLLPATETKLDFRHFCGLSALRGVKEYSPVCGLK